MSIHWHEISDSTDPELDRLAEKYHLHPLHIEDCRHRNQRAKVEENGYLFTVLKPVRMGAGGSVEVTDLDIFLGPDYVITVEDRCPRVRKMLEQIRQVWDGRRGDQLYYRILDGVVDSYLPTLDYFDDLLDDLQDEVLERASPEALSKIFDIKRSLIELRRVLANTRDVAGHLQRSEHHLIASDMWPFLRDIYDHVARNLDMIESLRDLLTGSLDVYLSTVANRTNHVMKLLTVAGTVALPVLVMSSLYGMNVKGMPWMESPYGAGIVGGIIVAATLVLLAVLRFFRWF